MQGHLCSRLKRERALPWISGACDSSFLPFPFRWQVACISIPFPFHLHYDHGNWLSFPVLGKPKRQEPLREHRSVFSRKAPCLPSTGARGQSLWHIICKKQLHTEQVCENGRTFLCFLEEMDGQRRRMVKACPSPHLPTSEAEIRRDYWLRQMYFLGIFLKYSKAFLSEYILLSVLLD